jgi:hypothetical protein
MAWRGRMIPRGTAILLAVLIASGVALVSGPPDVLIVPLAIVILTVPGYAIVRLADLKDPSMELLLGAVLSIALLGLSGIAGVYLDLWSPRLSIVVLLMVAGGASVIELRLVQGGQVRGAPARIASAARRLWASVRAREEPPTSSVAVGSPDDASASEETGVEIAPTRPDDAAALARTMPIVGIGPLRDRRPWLNQPVALGEPGTEVIAAVEAGEPLARLGPTPSSGSQPAATAEPGSSEPDDAVRAEPGPSDERVAAPTAEPVSAEGRPATRAETADHEPESAPSKRAAERPKRRSPKPRQADTGAARTTDSPPADTTSDPASRGSTSPAAHRSRRKPRRDPSP